MPDEITDLPEPPSTWGKWGEDDQIGAINYLDADAVLRGAAAIQSGDVFTLGLPIGREEGDPIWPGRVETQHFMRSDKGFYESGKRETETGVEASDDVVNMFLHGTTHIDALGHTWYGDRLYNDGDPNSTKGGLEHASIRPIAEHGVVGRGVLLDVAGHRGVSHLPRGERITLDELEACADEQGVDVESRSVLLVRTGWLELFYEDYRAYRDGPFNEPGITYSEALLEWFYEREIPMYGTDTIANEQTRSETADMGLPLHGFFHRDLGVPMNEMLSLGELAADCADDGQYDFLFVAAPLKVTGGTGSPVNPLAIK